MAHLVYVKATPLTGPELPEYEQQMSDWLDLLQITDWDVEYVRTHIITDDVGRPIRKRGPFWEYTFGNPDDAMLFKLMWGRK